MSNERESVQNPMIYYAGEIGWEYIDRTRALELRDGVKGIYFTEILKTQLLKLNKGIVNEERAEDIIRKLNLLRPTIEGNQDAFKWIRGEQSVFVTEERRERNVTLIDFEKLDNNVYHVTDEWYQKGSAFPNRADIVFLINGIPIALAETKSASKPNALALGVDQIRRYHKQTPEMFIATQVFEVTQLFDFFYGATWSTARKDIYNWKDTQKGDYEQKIKAFFNIERFLKMLKEHIIFISKDDVLSKVILRQHQTTAVEKVIERIHDTTKHRGLVWHTQGSGKTLTMITIASRLLRETTDGEKPTVLMIIDRNELESQLHKNIQAYGITNTKVAGSKDELEEILKSDYRGLVVSMIHKFEGMKKNINLRSSITVLIDEAHRSTGGDLGNYLLAAIPNATFIGFTGTPIDKLSKGEGTFKVFGRDDETGYLDKYSISESIGDGTTIELNYELAPSGLLVDKELLDREFLNLADAEGVSDIEELNRVLNRAVKLKEMMKSPDRVAKIAKYVASHFKEKIEPMGFKAFLVGVDREACALYKAQLDRYLPYDYSAVVYSSAENDPPKMREHYLTSEEEKQVRKDFIKKNHTPKILIVTEKLLTGYDAPILYCMYLDKPMRDHVLLQAIARVNRPYEDDDGLIKPFGFVLDFVGIFDRVEKALSFDSDVVASVIKNIDVLKNLFFTLMKETAPKYLLFTVMWDDKAQEKAVEHFYDKAVRLEFYKFYKQLQSLYKILSPDSALRDYIEDIRRLDELYKIVWETYNREYVDSELVAKTKMIVREYTTSYEVSGSGKIYQIGVEELEAVKKREVSDKIKVLNLRRILDDIVTQNWRYEPYLVSIGEQARTFAEAFEDRQKTTQEALEFYERKIKEYIENIKRRQEMKVDGNIFSIYQILSSDSEAINVEHAKRVNEEFVRFPDYGWNGEQERELRKALYLLLAPLVGVGNIIEVANKLLGLKRL